MESVKWIIVNAIINTQPCPNIWASRLCNTTIWQVLHLPYTTHCKVIQYLFHQWTIFAGFITQVSSTIHFPHLRQPSQTSIFLITIIPPLIISIVRQIKRCLKVRRSQIEYKLSIARPKMKFCNLVNHNSIINTMKVHRLNISYLTCSKLGQILNRKRRSK